MTKGAGQTAAEGPWFLAEAGLARNLTRVQHKAKGSFVCNSIESAQYAVLCLNSLQAALAAAEVEIDEGDGAALEAGRQIQGLRDQIKAAEGEAERYRGALVLIKTRPGAYTKDIAIIAQAALDAQAAQDGGGNVSNHPNRMGQPLSSYEAGYEAGYRDGAVALKAATEQAEHWAQAHREERVLREVATERAEACAKAAQDDRETLLAAEVDIAALERKIEVAERELRDCDAARTLVLSENERLANELMAMRAGRKAELEALQAKASLADEMASTFLMGLSAHSPASLKRRHDTLTTPVSVAEQVADREATIHQST